MGMVDIICIDAEKFEQIVNIPSTEHPKGIWWNQSRGFKSFEYHIILQSIVSFNNKSLIQFEKMIVKRFPFTN